MILGWLTNPLQLLILLCVSIIIIYSFNQKAILTLYDLKKKQYKSMRLKNIISILGLTLLMLFYGFFRFVYFSQYDCIVTLSKIKWDISTIINKGEFDEYTIFDLKVRIPKGMQQKQPTRNNQVIFIDNNKTILMISRNNSFVNNLFLDMASLGRLLGEEDSYVFGEKVLKEKISLCALVIRTFMMGTDDFIKIDSPKWKGYAKELIKSRGYEASLWHKEKNNRPISIIILSNDKSLSKNTVMQNIIGLLDSE